MSNATPTPTDVARRYLKSFETADPSTIASFVAVDFINEHTAGLGTGCEGRATYQERLVNFLSDMVGLTYEPEHLVSEGNQVAVFYTMRASWQGTAPFTIRGVQRLVVEDGLITQRTDYWDSAVFLSQVDNDAREALGKLGIS